MNKTPKLKSRTLGLCSRRHRETVVSSKDIESDSNNSRIVLNGNHLITNESEYKRDTSDKNAALLLKECRMIGSSGMVTPVKTQKLPSCDEDKIPKLNDESPDLPSDISRRFVSPEIEVSWDYSCSQVPRGSVVHVPCLKQRRRRFPEAHPPLLNLHPHLLPDREMSEEERKRKIDRLKGFYSELFHNEDVSSDSSTKNSQNNTQDISDLTISNKCDSLNKNKIQTMHDQYRDQIHSFFNDSSNDVILECTQKVEDELFESSQAVESSNFQSVNNSDNNMNSFKMLPMNNINKSAKKSVKNSKCVKTTLFTSHSNLKQSNNQIKSLKSNLDAPTNIERKFLNNEHVKTNLFLEQKFGQNQGSSRYNIPEEHSIVERNERLSSYNNNQTFNSKNKENTSRESIDIHAFFDDSIDDIMLKCSQDVEEELLSQESKHSNIEEQTLSKKHSASPLIKSTKVIKTNYNQTVHLQNNNSKDTFKKPITNPNLCVDNQKVIKKVNNLTSSVNIPKPNGLKTLSSHQMFSRQKETQITVSGPAKPIDTDITDLLNDDDAYLTSIDFSTIDTSSANEKSVAAPLGTSTSQSKIYSQHEIEAKRREALDKLRRKRWKI